MRDRTPGEGPAIANEITITASLSGYKPSVMSAAIARSIAAATFTMAGTYIQALTCLIGVTATAIPLGAVTTPHWAYFKNLDANNFLTIRNGSGGTDFLELFPGEPAFCPLINTCVPYGIADTAGVLLEYLIFSL